MGIFANYYPEYIEMYVTYLSGHGVVVNGHKKLDLHSKRLGFLSMLLSFSFLSSVDTNLCLSIESRWLSELNYEQLEAAQRLP
jgi:hypothetical protein